MLRHASSPLFVLPSTFASFLVFALRVYYDLDLDLDLCWLAGRQDKRGKRWGQKQNPLLHAKIQTGELVIADFVGNNEAGEPRLPHASTTKEENVMRKSNGDERRLEGWP